LPPRRVYWDACTFIALLNQEKPANECAAVWMEAERGETIIVTSTLTLTEVFKAKCEGRAKPLAPADDERVKNLILQKWVRPAILDEPIALEARQLLRNYPECKKPTDAIHLATAMATNVEALHTIDKSDLLPLNRRVKTRAGNLLTICPPVPLPKTEAESKDGQQTLGI
jgi:predicted nucleic acid-binding protein